MECPGQAYGLRGEANHQNPVRRAHALPPEALRLVGVVDRQSRQLSRIADDLLDVSRIRSQKRVLERLSG